MEKLVMVLPVVGKGYLGVFLVTCVIIAGVMLLNRISK